MVPVVVPQATSRLLMEQFVHYYKEPPVIEIISSCHFKQEVISYQFLLEAGL